MEPTPSDPCVPETWLVSGLVSGIPAHIVFDTRFEAECWVRFCAQQYAPSEVGVFPVKHHAQLMDMALRQRH